MIASTISSAFSRVDRYTCMYSNCIISSVEQRTLCSILMSAWKARYFTLDLARSLTSKNLPSTLIRCQLLVENQVLALGTMATCVPVHVFRNDWFKRYCSQLSVLPEVSKFKALRQ